MILGTITPNNAFVHWEFVKSLMALPKYEFFSASGPSLPFNRNEVMQYARQKNDDLLFIDSDIVFTPEDVDKIEKHLKDKDIITGVYLNDNRNPWIFKRMGDDYRLTLLQEGTYQIDACGAGFLGISKKVIQAIDRPFTNLQEGRAIHYEDIAFCHRANRAGFKIWCDSSIRVGHIRTNALY